MCSETEYMSSLQWAQQNQAQALDSGVVFVSGTSRMTREYPLFLAVESSEGATITRNGHIMHK